MNDIQFLSDQELQEMPSGDLFVFDSECYVNYWCIAFKHLKTSKFVLFEQTDEISFNITKLNWMLWRFCIIGFNSKNYDIPMISLALNGVDCGQLKEASDFIIKSGKNYDNKKVTPFDFEKKYKIKINEFNHIDLFNVCPVNGGNTAQPASLKLYAGRLHCKLMQDLPYEENTVLTKEQINIVKTYCCNDLDNTELLFNELASEIKLRIDMSQKYQIDLRSKSDAQIAEAVINNELSKILGFYPKKPKLSNIAALKYNLPDFISFKTENLKNTLSIIIESEFQLDNLGSPIMPYEIENLSVKIGKTIYNIGMGGLHSTEKQISHIASNDIIIADNDVESFYPRIILNQKLYPEHLGELFLQVYNTIVNTRIHAKNEAAKANKNNDKENLKHWKTISDSLKITINGSFGKLGNKYSTLYAPQLMLQVTITGQLVLLMLIEMLEEESIEVVSGNTDGIICKYHKSNHDKVRQIIKNWEIKTNFKTEETRYSAIYSRDVNSYIALKEKEDETAKFLDEKLGCKTKGAFCERGSALNSILSKNPETLVCIDAVLMFLKYKTPIEETIKKCTDVRRFVSIKNVRGGGAKDSNYLGKVVRWYYAKNENGFISYKLSGNKVAKTDGAKPLMSMPTILPNDINYDWYVKEATEMLYDCGRFSLPKTRSLF